MSFHELGLSPALLKAVAQEGYEHPTPIQMQAIGPILQHRDLLGCAQTGTGKTAAFALPILQNLGGEKVPTGRRKIRTLVLTPTRELAIQIGESFTNYGRHSGLRNLVIFGGVNQNPQVRALEAGTDILVATPGRLLDLMGQGFVSLSDLEIFVLDEADQMLDMGFIHDVRKVIAKLPAQRQTLFFSATMPPVIAELAGTILKDPVKVAVTPVSSTAEKIDQSVYFVDKNNKRLLLAHLLKELPVETALVFTRTKHGADKVVKDLLKADVQAEAIHGNKSQNARQRALSNFKSRKTWVLVATDIAARGLDIDQLSHVFNFELPNVPESYVHRIGRTARAGASGTAISFCEEEEKTYLRDIVKLTRQPIPVIKDHPFNEGMGDVPEVVDGNSFRGMKPPSETPQERAVREGREHRRSMRESGEGRSPRGHQEPRERTAREPRDHRAPRGAGSGSEVTRQERTPAPVAEREPRNPRPAREASGGNGHHRFSPGTEVNRDHNHQSGRARDNRRGRPSEAKPEILTSQEQFARDEARRQAENERKPRENSGNDRNAESRDRKPAPRSDVRSENRQEGRADSRSGDSRGRSNKSLPPELLRGGQGVVRPGLKRVEY